MIVLEGSGNIVTGGKLVDEKRTNAANLNGTSIADGKSQAVVKGDVLIVPPGVIHGWADIPDHVDYLSFRPSHGVMKNGWVNPTIAPK